ncbi:unnamed protein product [Caenorhabditis auriculariae]|uniref:C2 domain-containing protein n=1 Tax=Caenorhabditis auriculariae TaxID=2777116 RepID=A0A8S1H6T1_9PELO|nr:unnamed protein product [Caenorhabditis auriculariae]
MAATFCWFALVSVLVTAVQADVWVKLTVVKFERKPCTRDMQMPECVAAMNHMTLEQQMLPSHARRITTLDIVNGESSSIWTHFVEGRIADWAVSLQFLGIDPVYGILRTCDTSAFVRVFHDAPKASSDGNAVIGELNDEVDGQNQEKTIRIEGHCFVATIQVQAQRDICPWCVDNVSTTPSAVVSTLNPVEERNAMFSLITMLVLLTIGVVSSCSSIVLAILLCRKPTVISVYDSPLAGSNLRRVQLMSVTSKSTQKSWLTATSTSNELDESWGDIDSLKLEAACDSPIADVFSKQHGTTLESLEDEADANVYQDIAPNFLPLCMSSPVHV